MLANAPETVLDYCYWGLVYRPRSSQNVSCRILVPPELGKAAYQTQPAPTAKKMDPWHARQR